MMAFIKQAQIIWILFNWRKLKKIIHVNNPFWLVFHCLNLVQFICNINLILVQLLIKTIIDP